MTWSHDGKKERKRRNEVGDDSGKGVIWQKNLTCAVALILWTWRMVT